MTLSIKNKKDDYTLYDPRVKKSREEIPQRTRKLQEELAKKDLRIDVAHYTDMSLQKQIVQNMVTYSRLNIVASTFTPLKHIFQL